MKYKGKKEIPPLLPLISFFPCLRKKRNPALQQDLFHFPTKTDFKIIMPFYFLCPFYFFIYRPAIEII